MNEILFVRNHIDSDGQPIHTIYDLFNNSGLVKRRRCRPADATFDRLVLRNLQELSALGHEIVLRMAIVPGVNDDEENIRRFLNFELTRAGYRVREAEDGMCAIHEARTTPPDLIVLDMFMPVLSGRDVLRLLTSDESEVMAH